VIEYHLATDEFRIVIPAADAHQADPKRVAEMLDLWMQSKPKENDMPFNQINDYHSLMRSLEGLRFKTNGKTIAPNGKAYTSGLVSTRLGTRSTFHVVFFNEMGHVDSADLSFPDEFNHKEWHFYRPADTRTN
jgi:hypothetical protein